MRAALGAHYVGRLIAMAGRWIPSNDSTRIPRTHIVLDTESTATKVGGRTEHMFRCAVTSCDKMSRHGDRWLEPEVQVHETTANLWQWVTDRCKPKERSVLVAHNLGFDLRTGSAFSELPALGWGLRQFSLQPGATWLTWARLGATLSMVDSLTWLPTTLQNIGQAIGREKLSLPSEQQNEQAWVERCVSDVSILRDAWMRIIRWLRSEECGNWRPTGAGQSFSAFRHKHLTEPILVHDNAEVRTVERRAAWTGRAEPWRFGKQSDGPFTEWDYECAYARIAQQHDVPTVLVGEIKNATLAKVLAASATRSVLAECMVETSVPTTPTFADNRIVWPVGTFSTTLWENELRLAVHDAVSVEVTRAWVYRKGLALKQWADWILGLVYGKRDEVDPAVRILAKHWARALIGRFGTRYALWTDVGTSMDESAWLAGVSDVSGGGVRQLLNVGGRTFNSGESTDHPLSAPQIMSWIAAQCRVDLWGAMNVAGLENVAYVDTDSLIVTERGNDRLSVRSPDGLRKKAHYHSLDIIGTRRLIEDRQLKASGVPKDAHRIGPRSWSAESWQSLQSSLKTGDSGVVVVNDRRIELSGSDGRRLPTGDGGSMAYVVGNVDF